MPKSVVISKFDKFREEKEFIKKCTNLPYPFYNKNVIKRDRVWV